MKDIKGFEGQYAVTRDGRVWSYPKNQGFFFREGRWLVGFVLKLEYLQYHWKIKGKSYHRTAHRLVAQSYIDNPNNLPCVNHKDFNTLNNNVENLEWCTYQYNTIYSFDHSRFLIGENHHNAKLSDADVVKIKKDIKKKFRLSYKNIGLNYGVSKKTILNIKNGKVWRHIKSS